MNEESTTKPQPEVPKVAVAAAAPAATSAPLGPQGRVLPTKPFAPEAPQVPNPPLVPGAATQAKRAEAEHATEMPTGPFEAGRKDPMVIKPEFAKSPAATDPVQPAATMPGGEPKGEVVQVATATTQSIPATPLALVQVPPAAVVMRTFRVILTNDKGELRQTDVEAANEAHAGERAKFGNGGWTPKWDLTRELVPGSKEPERLS